MISIPNILSFLRLPLAFLFLADSSLLRCTAIALAMLTDSIDGYLARKINSSTKFGAILDPITDKFFVYFALSALFFEERLLVWQIVAMLSRDIAIFSYFLLMVLVGKGKEIVFRSIWAGKASTALQFIVLIGLVLGLSFSWITYSAFLGMGGIAFVELLQAPKKVKSTFRAGISNDAR